MVNKMQGEKVPWSEEVLKPWNERTPSQVTLGGCFKDERHISRAYHEGSASPPNYILVLSPSLMTKEININLQARIR